MKTSKLEINSMNIEELEYMLKKNGEAIVFQGCGGNMREWIVGVNEMFMEEEIIKKPIESIFYFRDEKINCLAFFLNDKGINISKLSIWRLQSKEYFDCIWLSDLIDNMIYERGM